MHQYYIHNVVARVESSQIMEAQRHNSLHSGLLAIVCHGWRAFVIMGGPSLITAVYLTCDFSQLQSPLL